MRLRFALLTICMLLGATVANAQFNAVLANFSQALTLGCGSGDVIPDGTTIQIFWDSLGNGPTADDRQPTEGPGFLEVNFNQFELNGSAFDFPGGFYTDQSFSMASGIPVPGQSGHPLYWLRICLDTQGIYWQSDTFRVEAGLNDYLFGDDDGEVHFSCVTGTCGGCPNPPSVTNLSATVGGCDSIVVTWDHTMDNIAGYRVLIDGELPYHYIVGANNRRYVDFVSPGGQDHVYRVRAFRICDPGPNADTSYSTAVETTGRRVVGPPTPLFMTASENECGRVRISWEVNTVAGLDSFRIFRDNVLIGTINNQTAGNEEIFFDNSPGATVNEYCVCGTSLFCQDDEGLATNGPLVCDDGSAGSAPVCTITNVAATSDRCDSVCVTFTVTCDEATSFEVFRNNLSAGSVPNVGGPNFRFCHAPAAGQAGNYQVRPVNACGPGTLQPAAPGVPGLRLSAPGQVQGIVASDTLCDLVRVTWTDLPEADSYSIRKQGTEIATVAGDINTYDDLAAVAGQTRTYTVVAINECGTGAVAAGNGGTRPLPNGNTTRATFTMVTAGPPNWTYSMEVNTGCISRVKVEDYCAGTTATAPNGWTVTVHGLDSIVYSTTDAVGFSDPAVTGFGLSHPTCDGTGGWTIGGSSGSIRGPLPVGENAEIPTEFGVKVFPNPFNPQTNFRIAIPQASDTRILVFNINGQLVRDMELGRMQAGYHTVQFGGADLPSGMYFARVQSGVFNSTHKLMLLK